MNCRKMRSVCGKSFGCTCASFFVFSDRIPHSDGKVRADYKTYHHYSPQRDDFIFLLLDFLDDIPTILLRDPRLSP